MNVSGKKIFKWRNLRGLTRQQLADLMKAAGVPISNSSLYRIEEGAWKRKPGDRVIKTIAKQLDLDEEALTHAFEEDRKAKARAKVRARQEAQFLLTDGVEFSRRLRSAIRRARAGGDVEYALENANWLDAALQRAVKKARTTAVVRDALAVERAYVLAEKVNIFGDTLSTREALRELRPILREGRHLQKLVSDEKMVNEVRALNCSVVQGLYYMRGSYATALRFRVHEGDVVSDPYWKLALHRVTASNLAYVDEKKKAFREKDKIRRMLDSGVISEPYTVLWAMDVMGRVHAAAKDPESLTMFERAWSFYDEIKKEHGRSRLREAQLAMDNLRAVLYVDPTNVGLAEQLARKGRNAAAPQPPEDHEHPRHLERIERLMSDLRERNRQQSK